jgi:hypothetical protein
MILLLSQILTELQAIHRLLAVQNKSAYLRGELYHEDHGY